MSSRWRSSSSSEPGRGRASGRARGPLVLAGILAFAAAVAGCTAFEVFQSGPKTEQRGAPEAGKPRRPVPPPVAWTPAPPPARTPFDHKFHLSRGLGCTDCHEGTDANEKAGMPSVETCMECHTEIDEKKPKEKAVAAFLDADGKTPRWSRVTVQSADVVFSHAVHAAKKLECAECHRGVQESVAVSRDLFVDMDACTNCHEARKAKNDCATCHRAAAKSLAEGKGPFWRPANHDPVWKAAHAAVADLAAPRNRAERCDDCHGRPQFPPSGDCATCHAATKPADHDAAWRAAHGSAVRGDPAAMEGCAVCHESSVFPRSAQCDVCHVNTRPANHERLWRELHGQEVRRDGDLVSGRCAFCHDKPGFPQASRCTGCHATEPPRDHTQSWRVGGGHGLAAGLDRSRCDACHRTDACSACHATVAPRSHRGGWGAPRDRHCVNCHLPLRPAAAEGCGVCHQGTPSHASAPPMPATEPHRPDATCRKCHFPPRNLRHADNGMNCVTCHR